MKLANCPRVTLAWAQSLDGSMAGEPGKQLLLSGPESSVMTHRLRSVHDAILVGIGTVLSDNPRLDVRHVQGPNPQPVILDSNLRTPPDCRLVLRPELRPWIFAAPAENPEIRMRKSALEALGCTIFEVPHAASGGLDLGSVLQVLYRQGTGSLMVEGGAHVLAAFMTAGLVDRVNVTVAPMVVRGLNPFTLLDFPSPLHLIDPVWTAWGKDMVLEAGVDHG